MTKQDINKIYGKIDSQEILLKKIANYLKTIVFNTSKIDNDLHKRPYKIRGYRK